MKKLLLTPMLVACTALAHGQAVGDLATVKLALGCDSVATLDRIMPTLLHGDSEAKKRALTEVVLSEQCRSIENERVLVVAKAQEYRQVRRESGQLLWVGVWDLSP
jgi:hypothetical protein